MANILQTTNYPTSFLEGTFGDKFYKNVVEPAKMGTGSKPPLGQVAKNWNPLKAFMPKSMGGTFYTKGTPAALNFLKGSGIVGAGITAATTGAQLGDWAYKNWEPATKFGDWAGGGIYDLLNPEETSIDPTDKNLFTQYYEDDPYAGIEGQTASLINPATKKMWDMLRMYNAAKKIKKHGPKVLKTIGTLTGGKAQATPGGYTAPQHHQDVSQGGGYQAPNIRSAPKGVTTSSGMHGGKHYARGGRVNYFDGGLASLWLRQFNH